MAIIIPMPVDAIASVPPGQYAVGVSGGADSVALLLLLVHHRPDLSLRVVHLDHQARARQSAEDARFVADLAHRLNLPFTCARRTELEPHLHDLPTNRSARFRQLRLALFRQVVQRDRLEGVLLAHHADDQAETILHRLLRGAGPDGLTGMRPVNTLAGVRVCRPLLGVRSSELRRYLREHNQPWREDASNRSDRYARNRIRQLLGAMPQLVQPLLDLADRARALRDWTDAAAPKLDESFPVVQLYDLPALLQHRALRRWLLERGCPIEKLHPPAVQRLLEMTLDAATPAHQQFPGPITVRRRAGIISSETF